MPQHTVPAQIATIMSQLGEHVNLTTRFAPSPNGNLHIGHAYAAICAHDFARAAGGRFLLRIEDIDGTRSRDEHVEEILADMKWLGLDVDGEAIFQSKRVKSYQVALERLRDMGLVYRCYCTRSEIAAAVKDRPVTHGPDGPVYPGTCRGNTQSARHERVTGDGANYCWRLDMAKAAAEAGPMVWRDLAAGEQVADARLFGDIVIWRKDAPASYHLAATLDDAADGVTYVVRGKDLFAYTALHTLLQKLLGLLQPVYWHHKLLLDANGEKLGKSKGSAALLQRRIAGENGQELAQNLRDGKLPLGISLSGD